MNNSFFLTMCFQNILAFQKRVCSTPVVTHNLAYICNFSACDSDTTRTFKLNKQKIQKFEKLPVEKLSICYNVS